MKNPKFKFSDLTKIAEISEELIVEGKITKEQMAKVSSERRKDIDSIITRHNFKVVSHCVHLIFDKVKKHGDKVLKMDNEEVLDELVDIVSNVNMTFYNDDVPEEKEEKKVEENLDTVE